MKRSLLSRGAGVALFVGLISVFPAGSILGVEAIPNWAAPATWSPTRAEGARALGDVSGPLPLIPATPCRIADTRNAPGPYGAPPLTGGVPRNFTLTGQCGIPTGANAVSLNVTVTNTQGPGFILIYPQGGSQPTVSTLNYVAGQTIANAAVAPLGTGGGITVIAGVSGTDLILDTNGYYAKTPASSSNYFELINSSPWVIVGKNTSSNTLATAVLGQANAPTGNTIGVWGETFSATNGARGVMGFAPNANGITYGVQGQTGSIDSGSAGVYGVSGYGDFPTLHFGTAGVRGISKSSNAIHGVSQWQGVEGTRVDNLGNYQTAGILGFSSTFGVWAVGNVGATGAKPFIEPHPTDATNEIAYVALEGPEAGTYFRGRARIHNGAGFIEVPESFRLVSDEEGLTVQITPIGLVANVAVVSADLNTIAVRSSAKDLEFYYVVNGVRKAFKDWEVITENQHYVPRGPEAKMPGAFSPEQRRRLIATGIYNEDGTVNLETAERLGWAKAWRDRDEQAKAAAAAYRAAREANGENK